MAAVPSPSPMRRGIDETTAGVPAGGPINPNPLSDADVERLEEAKKALSSCTNLIFDFLQSKGLFSAEKALRTELALNYEREISFQRVVSRNLWHSNLEKLLDVKLPRAMGEDGEGAGEEGEMVVMLSQVGQIPNPSGATPTNWGSHAAMGHAAAANTSSRSTPSRRLGVRLHQLHPSLGEEESLNLRRQRARLAQQSCVVFREGTPMDEQQRATVEMLALPLLYNPYIRGLEDSPELCLDEGVLIAGRYKVVQLIGKGSFSRVVQCHDHKEGRLVSVKVLHNDKDCVDQGVGEIRLLSLLREKDPAGEVPLVRLLDYFYYREHLLIVTELLRDSIFNFYRYLRDTSPEGHGAYFTLDTLRTLAAQLSSALAFMHMNDLVHCDLKPENVCIASASRRRFKIIDVGSAVLGHDVHFSYVQTRGYRAPEVMLGLPWGDTVDMWGVGCILAELVLGQQLFHGPSVEHVLAAQQAVLGPLPDAMIRASATRNLYFTPQGTLYTIDPPGYPPGAYRLLPVQTDLETLLDVDDEHFLDFLSQLLSLDPATRLTARGALSHRWLKVPGDTTPLPRYLEPRTAQQLYEQQQQSFEPNPRDAPPSNPPTQLPAQAPSQPPPQPSSPSSHASAPTATPPINPSPPRPASSPMNAARNALARPPSLDLRGAPDAELAALGDISDGVATMHLTPPADAPDPDEDLDTEQDMEPEAPPPEALQRRRGSGDGPSVPVDFREAAQAEASRSHEWRQRLMRLVVGSGRSSSASATASEAGSPSPINPSNAEPAGSAPGLGMDQSGVKPYVP